MLKEPNESVNDHVKFSECNLTPPVIMSFYIAAVPSPFLSLFISSTHTSVIPLLVVDVDSLSPPPFRHCVYFASIYPIDCGVIQQYYNF